jgi:hypothetical protein
MEGLTKSTAGQAAGLQRIEVAARLLGALTPRRNLFREAFASVPAGLSPAAAQTIANVALAQCGGPDAAVNVDRAVKLLTAPGLTWAQLSPLPQLIEQDIDEARGLVLAALAANAAVVITEFHAALAQIEATP